MCFYLGSRAADVFHAFDAVDAGMGDFTAGQPDVVPETPSTLISKPAQLAWMEGERDREWGGERERGEREREGKAQKGKKVKEKMRMMTNVNLSVKLRR